MSIKDLVFVSVAFGERYVKQQDRLKESILKIYPEANLMFWRERLPAGAKDFNESLYGFKVHAISEANKHYAKILWLDPAMILVNEIIKDFIELKVAAVKDANLLINENGDQMICNKALNYFRVSKDDVTKNKLHLVGGSLYYFNFDSQLACDVFETWRQAEADGIFGSQKEAASEQINGHRNDESCMAIAMHLHKCSPVGAFEIGYCIENNPIFIKKHFK